MLHNAYYTFLATKAGSDDCADGTSKVGLTISLDFLKRPGLQSPSPAPRSPRDGDKAVAGEGLLTLIRRAASSLILRTFGDEDGVTAAAAEASS